MLGVLDGLRREQGVGLVLVTHDLAVVSSTCSELNVMYAGRVVEHGSTDVLLSAPRHPYTAALLRSVPDPDQPVHRLLTIPGAAAGPAAADRRAARSPRAARPWSSGARRERPPLVDVGRGDRGAGTPAPAGGADEPRALAGRDRRGRARRSPTEPGVVEERVHR